MPKPASYSGSFSDLYEAMQQRQPSSKLRPPPQRSPAASPPQPESQQTRNEREGGREARREGGKPLPLPRENADGKAAEPFDINERPYRKGSFMLTNEEFWSLDELKLDLHKRFDLLATKDDVARCAFRFILADYQQQREASFLVRVLRAKKRK